MNRFDPRLAAEQYRLDVARGYEKKIPDLLEKYFKAVYELCEMNIKLEAEKGEKND